MASPDALLLASMLTYANARFGYQDSIDPAAQLIAALSTSWGEGVRRPRPIQGRLEILPSWLDQGKGVRAELTSTLHPGAAMSVYCVENCV